MEVYEVSTESYAGEGFICFLITDANRVLRKHSMGRRYLHDVRGADRMID